jgi:hypothetical protein
MPTYCLYLIPLYSIAIACSTLFVISWYLCRQKKADIKEIADAFSSKLDGFQGNQEETEQEIERQIDHRLDEIISEFKKQIPMLSMVLSKSKEVELKETAKAELIKLIPSIKQHFLQKLGSGLGQTLSFHAEQLIDLLWKKVRHRLLLLAAAVGFILGFLEVALIFFASS